MTGTLALLIRSLRTDARLARSHLFRLLFVGMIYFALIYAQEMSALWGAPGLRFLRQVAWLNVLLITVAGASFFSTVITEEKEEETLGLLRMAGLGPLALLLGKSVPRLVTAVLLLSLQLPFTLLSITLGGVTVHQVLAEYAALAAYLIFLSQLGLFSSVLCRRSRKATWLVATVLFVLVVLPPYLSMILGAVVPRGTLPWWSEWAITGLEWLSRVSVFQRTMVIMQTGFGDPMASPQVVVNLIAAAALFGLSWATFDLLNRGEAIAGPERGLFGFGRSSRRRAPRAWANPFVWKDFYFLAGGKPMILSKFVAYGLLIGGVTWLVAELDGRRTGFPRDILAACMLGTMLLAAAVELAMYASRVFNEEVKWRTLPVLAMLPHSTGAIAYSKLAGCLIGLIPAVTYFLAGGFVDPELYADALEGFFEDGIGPFLLAQYVVFAHLTALLSLALRWGAAATAFIAVYILGWFCIIPFIDGRSPDDTDGFFVFVSLLGLCASGVLQVVIGARLRSVAAQ